MAQKSIKWENLPVTKTTPGTQQFKDEDNRKHMIYVPKDELKKLGNPENITVTITVGEEK